MTREESADALQLMLQGDPSPAQIGAFMIAHRIRRPEPIELAGMIDTYNNLGPKIYSGKNKCRPLSFGMPFDGRNKTAPIYPLTSLLLIDASQPVILHGSGRMPVKYGITTQELFNELGLKLGELNINKVQEGFDKYGLAFIYQPNHFPIADSLINYREEIGKRPPIASMELVWSAHRGEHMIISGFVHSPTEKRHVQVFDILNEENFLLIKGLEGSIDIPRSRTIISTFSKMKEKTRLKLNPEEYSLKGKDCDFMNLNKWRSSCFAAIEDGTGPLYKSLLWNAGIYFWISGLTANISEGIHKAEQAIKSGSVKNTLNKLIEWGKE